MTIITGAALLALYFCVGSLVIKRCLGEWWFYSQLPAQPVVLVVECSAWPLMLLSTSLSYYTQSEPTKKQSFEA